MAITINKSKVRLYAWILLAWILLRLLIYYSDNVGRGILNEGWIGMYVCVINFLFFEHALPYIRRSWKKILLPLFVLWVFFMFYTFGIFLWSQIGKAFLIYRPIMTFTQIEKALENYVGISVGSIFFFGIAGHIVEYLRLKKTAEKLRMEKQEAELNFLKSQTNPHFLFNTLNNIYALARDKSDLAPESILRLSKILRYMLYEAGGGNMAIEQELKIINDYIELEKLRYDESLRINFHYNIEDMRQSIPPLILIPLVENAFKHGVSESRVRPFIDIHLSIKNRQLFFQVRNSSEKPDSAHITESIGLSNLRRQLELLYTGYSLSVAQQSSVFTSTLQINLASYVQDQMHNSGR